MARKRISEQSNGECIRNVCFIGIVSLIFNIISPLPTGLLPVIIGIGIVLLVTIIYLVVRNNSYSSSGSHKIETHTFNSPIKKSRILCIKCNSPVESDQEFCQQCGHNLKQG